LGRFTARLKPCPFKTFRSFLAPFGFPLGFARGFGKPGLAVEAVRFSLKIKIKIESKVKGDGQECPSHMDC
jgi:hypothetical protein